jgi:hypothetical protein
MSPDVAAKDGERRQGQEGEARRRHVIYSDEASRKGTAGLKRSERNQPLPQATYRKIQENPIRRITRKQMREVVSRESATAYDIHRIMRPTSADKEKAMVSSPI